MMFCRDLDPVHAPIWSVRVIMIENPQCLLGNCFTVLVWNSIIYYFTSNFYKM